jgi:hypothetical protein
MKHSDPPIERQTSLDELQCAPEKLCNLPFVRIDVAKTGCNLIGLSVYEPVATGILAEQASRMHVESAGGEVGSGHVTVQGYIYGDHQLPADGLDGPVIIVCFQHEQNQLFGLRVNRSGVPRGVEYLPERLSRSIREISEKVSVRGRRKVEEAVWNYLSDIGQIEYTAHEQTEVIRDEFKREMGDVPRIADWEAEVSKEEALRWLLGSEVL